MEVPDLAEEHAAIARGRPTRVAFHEGARRRERARRCHGTRPRSRGARASMPLRDEAADRRGSCDGCLRWRCSCACTVQASCGSWRSRRSPRRRVALPVTSGGGEGRPWHMGAPSRREVRRGGRRVSWRSRFGEDAREQASPRETAGLRASGAAGGVGRCVPRAASDGEAHARGLRGGSGGPWKRAATMREPHAGGVQGAVPQTARGHACGIRGLDVLGARPNATGAVRRNTRSISGTTQPHVGLGFVLWMSSAREVV